MRIRFMFAAMFAPVLASCASLPGPACGGGAEPKLVAQLLFGRNIGERLGVSENDFRRFIDAEVTPRFSDGFTVLDGRGQYRDSSSNRITREPSKVVMIVLGDETRDAPRLDEIAEAYKKKFNQQSVGLVTQRSCARF
ncbi:DUF3574 domain-containing protein [Terrarubrum flagellatum]|uniref:DUF3574 domain-containing protein n=1 Tax=Terrirubrum flagellatum TaxID=2895980 RepID=UPI0031454DBE